MLAEFRMRLANRLVRGIPMMAGEYPVTVLSIPRYKCLWLETDQIVEIPVSDLLVDGRAREGF